MATVDKNGNTVVAPRSARRGTVTPRRAGAKRRFRSTRYFLEKAEAYLDAADAGAISSMDAARRVAMVKDLASMFLVHKELELRGCGDEPVDMAVPVEEAPSSVIQERLTKRVTQKSGVDRHGLEINERTVTVESTGPGETLEVVADITLIE